MKPRRLNVVAVCCLLAQQAAGQSILFDFENAAVHGPLPTLMVGGISAQFSATGQGFSIQRADTMGFTPVGFSGNCIYPSSVYAADLLVAFSQPLTGFSILYAPQELACDSSARMRVTAYMNGTPVGTSTTNAAAGTWPSETLAFSSPQGFDSVVVHYDAPPPTGGDWGPIFMADNMIVTPAIVLTQAQMLPSGAFQLAVIHSPGATLSVLAATNLSASLSTWTNLGGFTEITQGQYQFIDWQATNCPRRFYRVSAP